MPFAEATIVFPPEFKTGDWVPARAGESDDSMIVDRVQQVIQLIGFVNSAPGFGDQPRVINGAVDLLVELYGDRGKPTRAAIGCQGLSRNHSVEIVMTVLFSGTSVRPPLA
jgi:enamine deaminase RidA (YjgF/YER057c/UK114 family)